MRYTDEQIAHVIHEANRALQIIQHDQVPSVPWICEEADIKRNAIESVAASRNEISPRELHETWRQDKIDHGWVWGPVKDSVSKTHPCLVSYDNLPSEQRDKNRLFLAIVSALTHDMY